MENINKKIEKELKKLRDEIKNNYIIGSENKISGNTLLKRKEMMSINFISSKQDIHYSIPCIGDDLFVDVEKKLYEKYPHYRETDNYFLINAKKISRFKTIRENKIESGLPVILIPSKENDNLNNNKDNLANNNMNINNAKNNNLMNNMGNNNMNNNLMNNMENSNINNMNNNLMNNMRNNNINNMNINNMNNNLNNNIGMNTNILMNLMMGGNNNFMNNMNN